MGFFWTLSYYVGAGMLSVQTGRAAMWTFKTLKGPTNLAQKYGAGTWAVINGAPKGYGRYLASQNFNIILVGDDQAKLTAEAKELKELNNIDTLVVKMNTESSKHEDYSEIVNKITEGRDISIMVHNTAKGTSHDLMSQSLE